MRLSTAEVRDVSPARAGRGARGSYRDCIGEQTSGRGVAAAGGAQIILPPAPHPRSRHTRHLSVRRYGDGPGRA